MEVGHWIFLAIREKGNNGKHNLHILDSLGVESGRRHRDILQSKLAHTPFFQGFPKAKALDVKKQSECECGARVAKCMEDLTNNYEKMGEMDSITNMIGRSVQWEKGQGKNEVRYCRIRIKDRLEGEKRKRGILYK